MIPKTALWQFIVGSVVFDPNSLVLILMLRWVWLIKLSTLNEENVSKSSKPLIKGNIKYAKSFKFLT